MQQRRLIDNMVLAEARVLGSNLTVSKWPDRKEQAHATIQIEVGHAIHEGEDQPNGKVLQVNVAINVGASSKADPEDKLFSVSARIGGAFVFLKEIDKLDDATLVSARHSLARMLYPLARFEIARKLTSAKFNDVPLAWDLGPPTSEDDEGSE